MAFYELRQYKVRPGKMAEWLKVMEEEIIPFRFDIEFLNLGGGIDRRLTGANIKLPTMPGTSNDRSFHIPFP